MSKVDEIRKQIEGTDEALTDWLGPMKAGRDSTDFRLTLDIRGDRWVIIYEEKAEDGPWRLMRTANARMTEMFERNGFAPTQENLDAVVAELTEAFTRSSSTPDYAQFEIVNRRSPFVVETNIHYANDLFAIPALVAAGKR